MNIKKTIEQIAGAGALLVLSAGIAHANVLTNPSFELPSFAGVEEAGAGNGWTAFGGGTFRIQGAPIGPAGAYDGDVVVKVFGESGMYQEFLGLNPTDTVTGTAWVLNDSIGSEALSGGQIAGVNLEWLTDGTPNGIVSFGSTIDANTPLDVWTQIGVVDAPVPAGGTNGVRLTLITGPFAGQPAGGAPRFDAASLEVQPIPVPAAVWLFGSGLIGLVGLARRRKA